MIETIVCQVTKQKIADTEYVVLYDEAGNKYLKLDNFGIKPRDFDPKPTLPNISTQPFAPVFNATKRCAHDMCSNCSGSGKDTLGRTCVHALSCSCPKHAVIM